MLTRSCFLCQILWLFLLLILSDQLCRVLDRGTSIARHERRGLAISLSPTILYLLLLLVFLLLRANHPCLLLHLLGQVRRKCFRRWSLMLFLLVIFLGWS